MRLLLAELDRLRSRRAVVLLLVAGFVFAVVATASTLWQHRPITDAEKRQAAVAFAQVSAENERQRAICEKHPERFGVKDSQHCVRVFSFRPESYVGRTTLSFARDSRSLALVISSIVGFLVLLAGTTAVGAEFTSGSISNTLLFRPSRWQVWAAKMTAVAIGVAVVAVVTVAVCLGLLAVVAGSSDTTPVPPDGYAVLAYRGLRMVMFVVAAGVIGAAVTAALRATIATVGLVVGYVVIGEALLRAVVGSSFTPWLASTRVAAFIDPPRRLVDYSTSPPSRTLITLPGASLYLGLGTVVVLVVSAFVFSRRDVA